MEYDTYDAAKAAKDKYDKEHGYDKYYTSKVIQRGNKYVVKAVRRRFK